MKTNIAPSPHILVFDSGLGGLSIHRELIKTLPQASFSYLADDAVFPYGALTEVALIARVIALMEIYISKLKPDLVVIACNTASTLVLAPLRTRFTLPFVGTVPAIKSGAERSKSGLFSMLATSGTVTRNYTRELIRTHAANCAVTLVGAQNLAQFAEASLRGENLDDALILHEIKPAFVETKTSRTDIIVLGCTHYPLILPHLQRLAPWVVEWIDPAQAIAKRAADLINSMIIVDKSSHNVNTMIFTSHKTIPETLEETLKSFGFADINNKNP